MIYCYRYVQKNKLILLYTPNGIKPKIYFNKIKEKPNLNNLKIKFHIELHIECYNYLPSIYPNNLTLLCLDAYDEKIENPIFPEMLEELYMKIYNQKIDKNIFPLSLKKLTLCNYNHKLISNIFPPSLEYLNLEKYNHELIPNLFPESLRTLELLSYNICLKPDLFPINLYKLVLYNYTCYITANMFPTNLQTLYLGNYNKQNLKWYMFPPNLKNLIMIQYNHILDRDSLPKSLKYLKLVNYKNILNYNVLPSNLCKLLLQRYNIQLMENVFPHTLTHLIMMEYDKILYPNMLPLNLKRLCLHNYNHKLIKNIFPSKLKYLILKYYDNEFNENVCPPNLKFLKIANIDKPINYFSNTLNKLIVYTYNNKNDKNMFSKLRSLYIINGQYEIMPNILPFNLIKLSISCYKYPLHKNVIPESVKYLRLYGYNFIDIKPYILPKNLRRIAIKIKNPQDIIRCSRHLYSFTNILCAEDYIIIKVKEKLIMYNFINLIIIYKNIKTFIPYEIYQYIYDNFINIRYFI